MPRYARYPSGRSLMHDYFPLGVKWLLIINSGIYIVTYLCPLELQRHITVLFALSAEAAVRNYYVWQLVTYMFLHGGMWHLLFNMLALWMFGIQLEQDWGTQRFLKYYFYCGVAAGVSVLVVNMLVGQWGTITLGASGAIFGVLVAFGVTYPDQPVLLALIFPMKAKYLVMILVGIELLVTFGPNTGVSTVAHLGGAAFGFVYLKRRPGRSGRWTLPDFGGVYRQWKLKRAKKKFQTYMKNHNNRGPWVH